MSPTSHPRAVGTGHLRAYGVLTRLYPARFRRAYRADLVALFADQLRDEGAARVWGRAIRDLTVTVPSQHLETRMDRHLSTRTVTYGAGAVAAGCVITGAIVGLPAMPVLLLGAVAALVVAAWAHRADRPMPGDPAAEPLGRRRWQVLGTGGALLVACIAIGNLPFRGEEMPEGVWFAWFASLITSFVLVAFGLALLVSHSAARRARA